MEEPCIHALETIPFLTVPSPSDNIYKDECTLCFENQKPTEPQAKITKLAFGVPGGISIEGNMESETITSVRCLQCNTEIDRTLGTLPAVIDAIIMSNSAMKKEELENWQWEDKPEECPHTKEMTQIAQPENPRLDKCDECDINKQLWLCMACGHIGCSRRQGDIGGNFHGVNHADSSGHPVAVKLGTITPEGNADMYCYKCDRATADSKLGNHLAFMGIDIARARKTEQTMDEMDLDRNMNFTVNSNIDGGQVCVPLFGAPYTGIQNLGNTCYMASVAQVMFHHPAFRTRYFETAAEHIINCTNNPANCLQCQLAKLSVALNSGEYSPAPSVKPTPVAEEVKEGEDEVPQPGINPRMFRTLFCRGHPLFSSNQQQDAMEFFQYFVKQIQVAERRSGHDPTQIFSFEMEQKLQCLECNSVRYSKNVSTDLTVPIPMDAAIPGRKAISFTDNKTEIPVVPFSACIDRFLEISSVRFDCPVCKRSTSAVIVPRFASFPDTLVVSVLRQTYTGKLDVELDVPMEMNLEAYRGSGLQPGEHELPASAPEPKKSSKPPVDEGKISNIMEMGFSRNAAIRALNASDQKVEPAIEWIMGHMDDPDLNSDIVEPGSNVDVPEHLIAQLVEFGFAPSQARRALRETSNNPERAVDWILNHPDATDDVPAPAASAAAASEEAPRAVQADMRPPEYELFAAINHRGASPHTGHYVAHLLVDGKWVLFNDRRVLLTPQPALGSAYVYFFRKK